MTTHMDQGIGMGSLLRLRLLPYSEDTVLCCCSSRLNGLAGSARPMLIALIDSARLPTCSRASLLPVLIRNAGSGRSALRMRDSGDSGSGRDRGEPGVLVLGVLLEVSKPTTRTLGAEEWTSESAVDDIQLAPLPIEHDGPEQHVSQAIDAIFQLSVDIETFAVRPTLARLERFVH